MEKSMEIFSSLNNWNNFLLTKPKKDNWKTKDSGKLWTRLQSNFSLVQFVQFWAFEGSGSYSRTLDFRKETTMLHTQHSTTTSHIWGDPYVGPHLCETVVYISLLEKKIPQTSHFQEMDFNYSFNSETIDFSWNKIGMIPMKSRKFELLIVCVVKNKHNKKIVKLNLFCPISKVRTICSTSAQELRKCAPALVATL